jgi:hypothetical protein
MVFGKFDICMRREVREEPGLKSDLFSCPYAVGVAANVYTVSIGFTVAVMEVRFSHVPIVPTSSHREIVQKTPDA